jgi:putative nucleotidyltransferase with HDIG domain
VIDKNAIAAKVKSLPTIPGTVARLAALLGDESAGAGDFERVIKPDIAITGNLLRLANSAYFGHRQKITSVRQAIAMLGLPRVYELASSVTFARAVPDRIPGYEMAAEGFWTHCVAVAVLSERLAVELGLKAPLMTFTAGLLHDAGKLVIGSFLSEQAAQLATLLRESGLPLDEAERRILGVDHAEIGASVTEGWDLPEVITWAARHHHAPNDVPPGVDQLLVDLVHCADGLAHSLGLGADMAELSRKIEPVVVARLGVRARRLEHVASVSVDSIREMAEMFKQSPGERK